jgi:hypothetical protein
MWRGWGLQVQKVGMVGTTMGRWHAWSHVGGVMGVYEYGHGIHAYCGYAQVGGGVHGIWGSIDLGVYKRWTHVQLGI